MKILSSNDSYSSIGFGIKINKETVKMANERCISNRNRDGETIVRIGNKSYNTYKIAEQIVADKEKLNKAFGNAWNKHAKPFIEEHLAVVFDKINLSKSSRVGSLSTILKDCNFSC